MRTRRGGSRAQAALALLVFSVLACLWWRPTLSHPLTATLAGGRGDPTIFMWFLTWSPWAVLHGHNPLLSHYLMWPGGVQTLWNTGLFLVSLLLAPVTLTLGPVAALNLLFVAAPASSAFTAWLLLRRHVGGLAAYAGALLYGFGPALAGQEQGHLQISLMTVPPLIVMAVEDLLRPRGHVVWRTGLRLGLLVAAQLLIGEELLAITALSVALWLVALSLSMPRAVPEALPRVLRGGLVAVGVTLLVVGVPLAYQFLGPLRIHGPIQATSAFVMRPRDLVTRTSLLLFQPGGLPNHANASEVGGYLGWPLLVLLAVGVVTQFRRPAMRAAFLAFAALEVLALGAYRTPGDPTSARLPWSFVSDLPVLVNLLPIRFAVPATLAAAALLAFTVDGLRAYRRPWSSAAAAVASVVVLLPLVPAWSQVQPVPARPACLRGAVLTSLTSTQPTLLLRYPRTLSETTQLWQAEAHFPFPIAGGYAVHPDPETRAPVLDADNDAAARAFKQIGAGGPLPDPAGAADVLATLRRLGLMRVLVTPSSTAAAERLFLERDLHLTPVPVADCTLYAVP